ncbi:MAG TPA: hypothetical protein VF169_10240 [Albitalea sp.]|uniref:hypothetical protein n=1 Tax=Piscinibacter sp. TaxID=1903157 RepID=UPI002ED3A58A
MTLTSLQALTWSTVTGAVVSALLLASGESGLPDVSRVKRAGTATSSSATDATKGQRGATPAALERRRSAKPEAGER